MTLFIVLFLSAFINNTPVVIIFIPIIQGIVKNLDYSMSKFLMPLSFAAILGGMIISTIFTLYVTPSMYLALARNTNRIDVVDIELKKQLIKK